MIDFPGRWLGEDSLTIELARRDLEHESSKHYKGFIVRSRLKRVLNEAVKSNTTVREEEVRRFPDQMSACCDQIARCMMPFGRTFMIALPTVLISRFRSFAAILPTSITSGWLKRLVTRMWLLNAKSAMHWSRSATTNRQDLMVCPTKCTWGCRTCLYLFWWICSTIGLPRESSLVALPRVWSHCWRKVADMFGRV